VANAEADMQAVQARIAEMNAELEGEIARIEADFDPASIRIETAPVRPKKTDIEVEDLALVWCP
jgi:hypothetical protein